MIPDSLWNATAVPAPNLSSLQGDHRCDVAIVGGGFTGLAAAHYLVQAGQAPVVLEANSLAWGASGRNGGVVSPKFRASFAGMMARHGRDAALQMYRLGYAAIDALTENIERLGLHDAQLQLSGHIAAAHTEYALAGLRSTADWISRETGGASSVMISREEVRDLTGSTLYYGGLLTPKAGGLHPLNYARGLARTLLKREGRLFEHSPVTRVQREGGAFRLSTPAGSLLARQVIYATNGYSSQTPATASLHRRLIPFRSAIIATEPLAPEVLAQVLPGGQVCGDTKRMLRWFRRVGDRVIFGGRGAFGNNDSAAAFRDLERSLGTVFPSLANIRIDHRWSGLVAMTLDYLPHAGRLDDGQFYAVGYNGGGVALSTYLGQQVAALSLGEKPEFGLMVAEGFRAIPLHTFRAPGVRLAAGWQQFLDVIGR